jgi:signal peptidase II
VNTPSEPLPPRKVALVATLALVIIALDQLTKLLVVANLEPGVPKRILGGVVYLSLFRNAGAAFSTGTGFTWILAVVAIAVVVVIIRMARKLRSTAWAIALGLVLGGAIGNLLDRLFNVADSGITCGAVVLVLTALLGIEMDGRRSRGVKETDHA